MAVVGRAPGGEQRAVEFDDRAAFDAAEEDAALQIETS